LTAAQKENRIKIECFVHDLSIGVPLTLAFIEAELAEAPDAWPELA